MVVIRAFVTGWPVQHSLSPALHGFWLARYGIAGSYEAVPVEPERFPAFLRELPRSGYAGGNVTIPHKETAHAICDRIDDEARAIGAVNTIWVENEEIFGSCTDSYGFAANLDQHQPDWRAAESALVLGAGGASRAVVHALVSAGVKDIAIVNRTIARAEAVAASFACAVTAHAWVEIPKLVARSDLLINTTSLGMSGHDDLELDLSLAKEKTVVTDIVYAPLETPLLRAARQRGLRTVDGLGMLLHQAVPGFERWFGVRPKVDAQLRDHLISVLEARKSAK
jgi:shikimate dehydrogenase